MQQTLENESIQNLSGIFNALLDFVPTYLKTIQQLVTGKYKKLPPITGFDFISHAVFPEIVSALHESFENFLQTVDKSWIISKYSQNWKLDRSKLDSFSLEMDLENFTIFTEA